MEAGLFAVFMWLPFPIGVIYYRLLRMHASLYRKRLATHFSSCGSREQEQ